MQLVPVRLADDLPDQRQGAADVVQGDARDGADQVVVGDGEGGCVQEVGVLGVRH